MEDYKDYFQGKKITVMGLGVLGRGVGDTAFLAECGAELIVTDLKTRSELKDSLEALAQYPGITYALGEHREEDFRGRDMILEAAGVPSDSPFLAIARNEHTRIAMSGALFARLSGIPIIGVTGTRGKSTVTHMIHHVLFHTTEGGEVLLGGNVRGVSNLQLLHRVTEDSIAVMELDSWQLQGFGYDKISPQIAVFTNFMEDHMNYYKGDMGAYFRDKAQIFAHQEGDGVLITTPEVLEQAKQYMKAEKREFEQEVRLVDSSILPSDCLLSMPGEHNRLNAAFALEALRATGMDDEEIFHGLATFPGVPGRLEYMGEKDGVKIYNDNNATTPSATLAAIRALGSEKKLVLIMGGADKEINTDELIKALPTYTKSVVLLPGTGTDRIKNRVQGVQTESLADALQKALEESEPGDTVLFSPGFASFGMFKNEYDRGDQFVREVEKL